MTQKDRLSIPPRERTVVLGVSVYPAHMDMLAEMSEVAVTKVSRSHLVQYLIESAYEDYISGRKA